MQIIVKKFGGTSLADLSRITRAVTYIKKSLAKGNKVVVVVSAMGKETDRLLSLHDKLDESIIFFLLKISSKSLIKGSVISSSIESGFFLLFSIKLI